jgi:NADH:ubiquinone oxidoreductase subunit E
MNKQVIKVCTCTECVMNGSMDIMESIENLKEMSGELSEKYETDTEIEVTPVKCLGDSKHGAYSPIVSINDELFKNTDNQTIMAEIVARMKKEGTK